MGEVVDEGPRSPPSPLQPDTAEQYLRHSTESQREWTARYAEDKHRDLAPPMAKSAKLRDPPPVVLVVIGPRQYASNHAKS
jgi:hypothetical protein